MLYCIDRFEANKVVFVTENGKQETFSKEVAPTSKVSDWGRIVNGVFVKDDDETIKRRIVINDLLENLLKRK